MQPMTFTIKPYTGKTDGRDWVIVTICNGDGFVHCVADLAHDVSSFVEKLVRKGYTQK